MDIVLNPICALAILRHMAAGAGTMPAMNPFNTRSTARPGGGPRHAAVGVRRRHHPRAHRELKAFDTIRYAQKANSNMHLLRLMREQGVRVDAVSLGEIERALAAGYDARGDASGHRVHGRPDRPAPRWSAWWQHGIPVNAGSIDMLRQLGAPRRATASGCASTPASATATATRPTPAASTASTASGTPTWTRRWRPSAARAEAGGPAHAHRLGRGLRPPGSRCAAPWSTGGARGGLPILHAISAGGGLSIPYRAGDARIDTAHYFGLWDAARKRIEAARWPPGAPGDRARPLPGGRKRRAAGRGARGQAMGSQRFALVDAGFNDLMRPSMYGAHHEISVLPPTAARARRGPPWWPGRCASRATCSPRATAAWCCRANCPRRAWATCWSFTTPGAYGASMSSNYNSRPLAAEVLVDGGQGRLIRRRQRIAELLALETDLG
jgi:diaminopimelate decarboxylase